MMPTPSTFRFELRGLFGNFAAVLGVQTATALLQLATVALIADGYGPEGNGIYVVALLLPTMLASFLNLGINAANVYYLGSARFPARAVLDASLRMTAGLALTGLVIGALLIQLRAEQVFPGIDRSVLWIALATFPVSLALGFLTSVFHGLQRFRELNLCLLIQPAIAFTVIGLSLLTASRNPQLLVLANLGGATIAAVTAFLLLRRSVPPAHEGERQPYLRDAFGYGYKAYLSNLLTLVQSRADTYLVNMLINPAAAGIYSIAFQLGEKLWMLSQAVSTVLLPRLSQLAGNEERRIQITTVISRLVFLISALGALLFAAIAYPLIVLLFGADYEASYLPFLLLLPGMVALAPARVVANDIAARGRPELNLYMAVGGVIVTIAGNLLVVPVMGIAGAALVTSGAYIFDLLLKMLVYRAITGSGFLSPVLVRASDLRDALGALRGRTEAVPAADVVRHEGAR